MPELPEVETIVKDLKELIVNKDITEIIALDKQLANFNEARRQSLIIGQKILDVSRRGKYIAIKLANIYYLVIHLKMTGQLIWVKGAKWLAGGHPTDDLTTVTKPTWPNNTTRLIINFSDGSTLYFNDARRFGWIKLMSEAEWQDYQNKLGVEPLSKNFTEEFLQAFLAQKPRSRIKPLLLNQQYIAGLGNIYTDESLFRAGIRPDRLASHITSAEAAKLASAIRVVLTEAIKHRGTTFSDYRDGRGQKGNFVNYLQVYGRTGQQCHRCGQIIQKTILAGRGTHFCPHCQQ